MKNTSTEARLAIIPKLYETEHIPTKDKIIHAHFHIKNSHWLIAEFDQVDTMFGYCILNNDFEMAEWGYVGFSELKTIKILGHLEVEYDINWMPTPAGEVGLIKRGDGIVSDPRDEENGGTWTWHTLLN